MAKRIQFQAPTWIHFWITAFLFTSVHAQDTPQSQVDTLNPVRPLVIATTPGEWNEAADVKSTATLQVTFPTHTLERDNDFLSQLMTRIPDEFAELQLNTVGRGLHSSIAYLDDLTFEEAQTITRGLARATLADYERHGLTGTFTYFDPNQIEIVQVGTQSIFLALKPHSEFREWQNRFYGFLKEFAPLAIQKHQSHRNLGEQAMNSDHSHFSLLQWGPKTGILLDESQVAQVRARLERLLNSIKSRVSSKGDLKTSKFSLATHPIRMSLPPRSLKEPPLDVFSIVVEGHSEPKLSRVVRWRIGTQNHPRVIEISLADFLSGVVPPTTATLPEGFDMKWIPSRKTGVAIEIETFRNMLSPQVRAIFDAESETLSPTLMPQQHGGMMVAVQTHPYLAPSKALAIFQKISSLHIDQLQTQSQGAVVGGLAVYASSVREEIANPSDYDLLLNTVVDVAESNQTIEEARSEAARLFVEHFFNHVRSLVKSGTVSISELRVGSDGTMGIGSSDPIADLLNNPYLTQEDVMKGTYVDKSGEFWSLKQLVELGDFLKFKFDLSSPQGRIPISLQVLIGFKWKGKVHFMHTQAFKGVHPLMRTAIYESANSYAIATALTRAEALVATQKGAILPSALRDLLDASRFDPQASEPVVWSAKFFKKFYNLMILLNSSGLRLDEYFTRSALIAMGSTHDESSERWLGTLIDTHTELLQIVNRPHMALLNQIKRIANDLYEFSERKQEMTHDQWETRKSELEAALIHYRAFLIELKPVLGEALFHESGEQLKDFEVFFNELKKAKSLAEVNSINLKQASYDRTKAFDKSIRKVETIWVTPSVRTKGFLTAFMRELEATYHRYVADRSQDDRGLTSKWSRAMLAGRVLIEKPKTTRAGVARGGDCAAAIGALIGAMP